MKRGQMTLFVVIGFFLIIVLLVAALFLKMSSSRDVLSATGQIGARSNDIMAFSQSCLDQVAEESLYYLGLVGLRTFQQNVAFDEMYTVPYLYYEGSSFISGKTQFEDILASYVETQYGTCIDSYHAFPAFTVQQGEVDATVHINGKTVTFALKNPTTVSKGSFVQQFDTFSTIINLRLDSIIKSSLTIINEFRAGRIPWGLFSDMSLSGILVTAYTVGEDSIVVRFVDQDSTILNEPYVFQFAGKVKA